MSGVRDLDKEMPLHGALAGAPITLAPSSRGIGPNTYLAGSHFWAMLCAAIIVHMAVLVIASMFPDEKVTSIPVRALSFKLGQQESMAAYGLQAALERTVPVAEPAAEVPQAVAPEVLEPTLEEKMLAEDAAKNTPTPAQYTPVQPVAPEQPRQTPVENRTPPIPEPAPQMQTIAAPAPVIAPVQPAIAPNPQRYVRENGLPSLAPITGDAPAVQGTQNGSMGGVGTQTMLTAKAEDEIRTRYEQQISLWIEKHHIYPQEAGRATGRVVMRVRVDRQGYVRYYAVERGSGNVYLDRAAIEMVRRANPMPAAPANYPASNLIEFLIPILFEAP